MARLKSVSPISNEDTKSLPVKELSPAIAYYESVLGFTLVRRDPSIAVLKRDDAEIGLTRAEDHKPQEAGSVAFAVDDLDALHQELSASGGAPGEFGISNWGGKRFRTFFMREDENGYCYCFHCPA